MARTLVGILQILLKQDVTQKAPAINAAIRSIEQQAARLGNSAWGAAFERQLDRLKITPAERAAIAASYDRLARDINGKISRADLTAWRHGTLSHLTQVRAGLKETALQAKQMHAAISGAKTTAGNLLKPGLVALGAYTGWYAAGIALREGFNAAGSRQREFFRQDMAGLNENEKAAIVAEAQRLTIAYPSVEMTNVMEMARTARNTMGTTSDGLAILEDMTRGLVTLQSSQGVDAGNESMMRLIRGLDNLGVNAGGELGLAGMREVIAGAIRAAQIEGGEIDVGQYFEFARRAKVAGPALSNEFLATTAATLMQDMTASGAGTAISSAYQAFVVGSSAVASKVNLAEQRRLGLRTGEGGPQGMGSLVDSALFGENPYQWVKKNLIPALTADGVNMEDETAIAQAVAKLSRNTMATGLLTRLVTQSPQVDRLIGMYDQAMGPEAADRARVEDPFVAMKGFTSSLANLSAALGEHVMPVIVPALNSLTDTINGVAAATRDASGLQVTLGSLAAVIAGFGALKIGTAAIGGIAALVTAGPSLQTAAVMLQGAATSLGGQGVGDLAGGGKKGGFLGNVGGWLAGLGIAASPAILSELTTNSPTSMDEYNRQVAEQGQIKEQLWGMVNGFGGLFSAPEVASVKAEVSAVDAVAADAQVTIDALVSKLNGVNTTLNPQVDTSSLERALTLARTLSNVLLSLTGPAGLMAGGGHVVEDVMTDYGVAP